VGNLFLINGLRVHLASARTLLEKGHSRVERRSSVELGRSQQDGEEAYKKGTDNTEILKEPKLVHLYCAE
jgi:hypothetical protein